MANSNNRSMDWDKLKVFHAAAEAGSFTHAGEQLGLSQSAVSRQVSALESELSVSLFHRHARGLILTEQGEMLYRTAHEVFMKLEAARTKQKSTRLNSSHTVISYAVFCLGSGAHQADRQPRAAERRTQSLDHAR